MKRLFKSVLHIVKLPFILIGVVTLTVGMCVADTYTKIKDGE